MKKDCEKRPKEKNTPITHQDAVITTEPLACSSFVSKEFRVFLNMTAHAQSHMALLQLAPGATFLSAVHSIKTGGGGCHILQLWFSVCMSCMATSVHVH